MSDYWILKFQINSNSEQKIKDMNDFTQLLKE